MRTNLLRLKSHVRSAGAGSITFALIALIAAVSFSFIVTPRVATASKLRGHETQAARHVAGHAARGASHAAAGGSGNDGAHSFRGLASYYQESQGLASGGGRFVASGYTCAHRTLPFGTKLRVLEPKSGRSVVVTVNDRGPFTRDRVLDLSLAAAKAIGLTEHGVMLVVVTVIEKIQ